MAVLTFSMSAGLLASTVTPGSTAPEGSSDHTRDRGLRARHRGREQEDRDDRRGSQCLPRDASSSKITLVPMTCTVRLEHGPSRRSLA